MYSIFLFVTFISLFLQNGKASIRHENNIEKPPLTFPLLQHHQVRYRRILEEGDDFSDEDMEDIDSGALRSYGPHGRLYQGYGTHYVDI